MLETRSPAQGSYALSCLFCFSVTTYHSLVLSSLNLLLLIVHTRYYESFLLCWSFPPATIQSPLHLAAQLAAIAPKQTLLLRHLWKWLQDNKELHFVKPIILCNICSKKSSPFPLAIALKKGDTNLPETSSGCMVIPSLTAWYPFSMMTGAHPNHKVNMLPWTFASCRWERSQESRDEIPHAANKDEPVFTQIAGTSPKVQWCSPSFPQDCNYLWEA